MEAYQKLNKNACGQIFYRFEVKNFTNFKFFHLLYFVYGVADVFLNLFVAALVIVKVEDY